MPLNIFSVSSPKSTAQAWSRPQRSIYSFFSFFLSTIKIMRTFGFCHLKWSKKITYMYLFFLLLEPDANASFMDDWVCLGSSTITGAFPLPLPPRPPLEPLPPPRDPLPPRLPLPLPFPALMDVDAGSSSVSPPKSSSSSCACSELLALAFSNAVLTSSSSSPFFCFRCSLYFITSCSILSSSVLRCLR